MDTNTTSNVLLEAWSLDTDVNAARAAVDTEISSVELADRISKMFVPY